MGAEDRRERIDELAYRAELRSTGEDEDTGIIEMAQKSSTPAPAKGVVAVLNTLPPWGRVAVLLAVLGVVAASGLVGAVLGRLGWVNMRMYP